MTEPHQRMNRAERRSLAEEALGGFVSGPTAPLDATAGALERAETAAALILVEGISDQIAIETLAARSDRNLDAEAIVVLPVGGAHAVGPFMSRFGPRGADLAIAGLCDAAEEDVFRRALVEARLGTPRTREEMAKLGFHVCVADLEDELIRAAGVERIESLLDSQGDLGSFRTLQMQPNWRTESSDRQMRRFFGSGARRKLRYARLIVEMLEPDEVPTPLRATLAAV